MHRLGALAHSHLPAALAPAAQSATSLALPVPTAHTGVSITGSNNPAGENPWNALHVHLLPLFNGEALRKPIEDLNMLVRRHIQTVVSVSLSKTLPTLDHDAADLISAGMVTLNAKLVGVQDDKLLLKVVEIWSFFWDQVLPYVEGVLLPLQTDALISSLYRNPKPHRSSSPTRASTSYHIDVRLIALKSFRDKVVVPLFPRLYARLSMPPNKENVSQTGAYQPRLQQMLLVLTSVGRQRPSSFSLTAPPPQPSVGETAITDLLRLLRSRPSLMPNTRPMARMSKYVVRSHTPNMLWGGLPRDRRGRVVQKQQKHGAGAGEDADAEDGAGDLFGDGVETPRNGYMEREREEREFLESLRSPDVELAGARASFGGWGLGGGSEDAAAKTVEEDDEEENLDWDQAQAAVERMVGMKPEGSRR